MTTLSTQDLALAIQKKEVEERQEMIWRLIQSSFIGCTVLNVAHFLSYTPIGAGESVAGGAVVGALYVTWKDIIGTIRAAARRDIPDEFIAELQQKAAEISAYRNGRGVWIVRDPTEASPRVMSPGDFAQYEKLLASEGRALDRLQLDGERLTYSRYVGGKLHAADGQPAVTVLNLKTGEKHSKFFENGISTGIDKAEARLPIRKP
ncbi:MAG: hypothetical protein HQL34_07470 [Alphaproteobacteria bacterium]|nr:hypothetical protein [Alphaproteobacteria bacterium]